MTTTTRPCPVIESVGNGRASRSRRGGWAGRLLAELFAIVIGVGIIEGIIEHERPVDVLEWSLPTALGVSLLLGGLIARLAAIGSETDADTARRGRTLRTLSWFGAAAIYAGFCVLMDDDEFYYFGALYLALAGVALAPRVVKAIGRGSPGLELPLPAARTIARGDHRGFSWARARRRGAVGLVLTVAAILLGVETMSRLFSPGMLGSNEPPDSPIGILHR